MGKKRPSEGERRVEGEEEGHAALGKVKHFDGIDQVGRRNGSLDAPDEEMGPFEDDFEDEYEEEEEEEGSVIDGDEEEGGEENEAGGMTMRDDSESAVTDDKVYLPGMKIGPDETLVADQSTYEMLHSVNVTWPCLSFDILRDNLGDERHRYPATTYLVTGSQADQAKSNEITVMKLSQIHKTQRDGDDDEDDDADDEDDENLDDDPLLDHRCIHVLGGVNRIRARPLAQGTILPEAGYYLGAMLETGKVQIFDAMPLLNSIDTPGYAYDRASASKPIHTIDLHGRTEGFAMDWSPPNLGSLRLATGDLHSKIHLTSLTPAGFTSTTTPTKCFTSHTSSVEDLQWSPTESTVFASCSADQSVRIWDTRAKDRKSLIAVENAHASDVNVMSWNKKVAYLITTGGDEGNIKVWDLRTMKSAPGTSPTKSKPTPIVDFAWHKGPITSIEWHPTDESVIAASGADDQVTLWDLSVELDDEELAQRRSNPHLKDVPGQLLFSHLGQKEVKEIHWHSQMPGTLVSTALTGLNIFKTISI